MLHGGGACCYVISGVIVVCGMWYVVCSLCERNSTSFSVTKVSIDIVIIINISFYVQLAVTH